MNRFKTRLPVVGLAVLVTALISGCGSGQISQTANQEPAVNGNRLTINNVALRDIRIRAVQPGDAVEPGKNVELVLVVVNQSPDTADRLKAITTDIGTVKISGDTQLPAGGMLFVGTPDGQKVEPGPREADKSSSVKAEVTLAKPISNGLTYNFTFDFDKAGQGSVPVPISVGLEHKHG